jgi:hypothetical protein
LHKALFLAGVPKGESRARPTPHPWLLLPFRILVGRRRSISWQVGLNTRHAAEELAEKRAFDLTP